jgi:hypothetical protein
MATKRTNKTRGQPAKTLDLTGPEESKKADQGKSTKPRHFRKKAQEEIGKKYGEIVEKLAEEATKGSVQHTKLLFDLGGVKEEVEASTLKRRRPPSLGKLLLKEAEAMKRNKEKPADSCAGPANPL